MAKLWKVIYSALFLGPFSKKMAEEVGKQLAPELEHVFAHHLTLKFKPGEEEIGALAMGERVTLQATGYVVHGGACALVCALPNNITYSNDAPAHITLCTGNNAEGKKIPPKASKTALEEGKVVPFNPPLTLHARIGVFNGKEDKFDLEGSRYEG